LDGDEIRVRLPQNAAHLIERLREQKTDVITILRALGGRLANFPHCPTCTSYALYHRKNHGDYECQTCGRQGISEDVARRTQ
jgi:transposase-like protein